MPCTVNDDVNYPKFLDSPTITWSKVNVTTVKMNEEYFFVSVEIAFDKGCS